MDGEPWGHPVIMVPCSLPHTPVGLGGPVHGPVMASRATGFGGVNGAGQWEDCLCPSLPASRASARAVGNWELATPPSCTHGEGP